MLTDTILLQDSVRERKVLDTYERRYIMAQPEEYGKNPQQISNLSRIRDGWDEVEAEETRSATENDGQREPRPPSFPSKCIRIPATAYRIALSR